MLNAETYITDTKGIGGQIRSKYEDFYVEEIPETIPSGEGPNTWIWIEKVGRNTLDVVLDMARDLHLNRKITKHRNANNEYSIIESGYYIS